MAKSGRLIETMAAAMGLPRTRVVTTFRGLRPASMISIYGRGMGAAEMTEEDAAVLLVAIATSATASYVETATRCLLGLPLRGLARTEPSPGQKEAVTRDTCFDGFGPRTFGDALRSLLDPGILEDEIFDPVKSPSSLSIWIGMDTAKSGGIALIEASETPSRPYLANLYSSWPILPSILGSDLGLVDRGEPRTLTATINLLQGVPPALTFQMFKGDVISAIVTTLRDDGRRPRRRTTRMAKTSGAR
jgi:hypothetical protein